MVLFLTMENLKINFGEFDSISGEYGVYHNVNSGYMTSWINFVIFDEMEFWKSEDWIK